MLVIIIIITIIVLIIMVLGSVVVAQAGAQVGRIEVWHADAAIQASERHLVQAIGPSRIAAGGAIELRLLHCELHTHAVTGGEVREEVVPIERVALLLIGWLG